MKTNNRTYLIGQSCLFQHRTDQKSAYQWGVMRRGHHKPYQNGQVKARGKHRAEGPKSPKKKNSVRYLFYFVKKNYNKKSLEGLFQNRIQTAISGNDDIIKTDTRKKFNRKLFSRPLFQTEKRLGKNRQGEINPKNGHCLRGLEGKYGRWEEILRNILNGKPKIVQNKKRADSVPDNDDDDEDDGKMPEEIGTPIRHLRKGQTICASTDQSGRRHTTNTYRRRNIA